MLDDYIKEQNHITLLAILVISYLMKIISLVGLTSSGKSIIGVELAKRFNGEIISCDSRQVYRGLDIGTGKITKEEMRGVPHHLIDIIDPGEGFDVYRFQQLAFNAIEEIISRGKLPILVGGTGLYSRSVVENYDFNGSMGKRKYDVLQFALLPPKEWLENRILERNSERFRMGMLDEIQGMPRDWLYGLGYEYRLNIDLIEGKITQEDYKLKFQQESMRYAKRQRTWFKKEKNTIFLSDYKVDQLALYINDFLGV